METVLFREHKASFGAYLRALRVGRGLSLRDAATKLDVSLAKLQKMETGGRFRIESPTIFDAMAAVFERPVAEVLAAAGVRFDVPPSAAVEPDGPTLWRFSRSAGWAMIPDFTHRPDGDCDCDDDVRAAGFSYQAFSYGHEYGLHVQVHPHAPAARADHGYEFFVWVNIGDNCHAIVVPRLPDLIALLNELKPLAEPQLAGITAAPSGWTAGGKPVAAFGLTHDGGALPLVAASRSDDTGLVVQIDAVRWR